MKLLFTTIMLTLFLGFNAYAQERPAHPPQHSPNKERPGDVSPSMVQHKRFPSKEELQSQKIAFFTQELELTPDEAQKFWPVYNAEEKKQFAARKAINEALKELNDALKSEPQASPAEIKVLMNNYFKACEEEISVQSDSFEEISKVLPVHKAAKTFSLEEKFRVMLIKQLRK